MSLYQPELQVSARDTEEIKQLADAGADAIFIGNEQFANRQSGNFSLNEIEQTTKELHQQGKKIYVMVNVILHNQHLEKLPSYLKELERANIDGIVAGDQSIYQILRDEGSKLALTWNPETLSTNSETLKFWHRRGLRRAKLSNELSLDAVIAIKNSVQFPIDIQIHGMTNIFQSKRKLVRNYYNQVEQPYDPSTLRYMKESRKPETHYPILEDANGTHIMSNKDLAMIEYLDQILDAKIDGLYIESLLKTRQYNQKVVSLYREAIDTYLHDSTAYKSKKTIFKQAICEIQSDDRKLDTGFYFKAQID